MGKKQTSGQPAEGNLQEIISLRDRFAKLRAGLAESGATGDLKSLYIRTCVLADMCEQLCSNILAGSNTPGGQEQDTSAAAPADKPRESLSRSKTA